METLEKILATEVTEYEFKSALEVKKPKSWLKTVSAFANGLGGSIYLGIDDATHKPVHIDDIQAVADKISELIKVHIDPTPSVRLTTLDIDGETILRLEVSSGVNTPYYYSADGNKIAFYRLGNESVQCPPVILNELILKGRHQTFDSLDSGLKPSDYSFTLFDATYREKTRRTISRPEDYISFGMQADERLTFAGALFADQYAVYQSRIFCTRWNGLEKTSVFDANDDAEYEGNVIKLLDDALGFVRHNSSVKWFKTGKGRKELPDYPQVSVYEALVNAIVHRDYMIKGSEIHIDMYDDRLEIVSPGGMVDGRRIQDINILKVASIRRNPVICDILQRLKFMERRGSGLKKIVEQYSVEQRPTFESTGQAFIVTLKNLNYSKTPNGGLNGGLGYDYDVLKIIKSNPKITQKDIVEQSGIPLRTVQRIIIRLQEQGKIERAQGKRNGYWVVK
jgi:ATP-dependent DNA helicase RecG